MLLSLCFLSSAKGETVSASVNSFSVKNTQDGIALSWSRADSAKGYRLYRTAGKIKNVLIATVDATQAAYTDKSATPGEKYTYKVKPYYEDFNGISKTSEEIYRLVSPEITEIKNTENGISLSWKKTKGEERYSIYRKEKADKKWTGIKTVKNTTGFTDTNAESGKSYIYRITAKKASSVSAPAEKEILCISAPVITSVKNKKDCVEIRWEEVNGATEYVVLRRAPSEKWKTLQKLKATENSYKDLTAKENIRYRYTVKAVAPGLKSGCFTENYCIRLLPVEISSAKNTLHGIKLKWNKSSAADGYRIYRSDAGSSTKKKIATIKDENILTYTDSSAQSGKKYTYYLIQYNGNSLSVASKGKAKTFVAAPDGLKAKKDGSKVILSWQKVTGASGYDIYRKTDSNSKWTKLISLGDKNSYTDKTAKSSTVYYYRIRATISNKNYSAYSEEIRSSRVDPSKKMIALTYDDGPSGDSTKRILDVLEKYDARATFFVIGSRIPSYYKNLQRADKLGCEIANHTYSHINLPSSTNSTILNEINKTNSLVKQYTGKTPTLIRAPGGSTNERVRSCVNMPFIYWSIDTRDWEHRSSSKTIASIKNNARDGAIVLMHDIHMPTAVASETIIPWLINQGYQLVTVSELMEYKGIKMHSGTTYYNAYK